MADTRRQFLSSTAAAAAMAGAACTATANSPRAATHIVLLGDSIFDNGRYVRGKPSVIEQLAAELSTNGKATLLASDGDLTADVAGKLQHLPADATHLVVSAGGNDALRHTGLLRKAIENSAELLSDLATIREQFRGRYAAMLDAVLRLGKPTAVCTVYDSNFEQPEKGLADVALCVFNDAIIRCAAAAGVPLIDLRRIFSDPADYANPIEPSEIGGAKMVKVIVQLAAGHDFTQRRTAVYG